MRTRAASGSGGALSGESRSPSRLRCAAGRAGSGRRSSHSRRRPDRRLVGPAARRAVWISTTSPSASGEERKTSCPLTVAATHRSPTSGLDRVGDVDRGRVRPAAAAGRPSTKTCTCPSARSQRSDSRNRTGSIASRCQSSSAVQPVQVVAPCVGADARGALPPRPALAGPGAAAGAVGTGAAAGEAEGRGDAVLGVAVHALGPDQHLDRDALRADHRGVQGAVEVVLRRGDEVLEPARAPAARRCGPRRGRCSSRSRPRRR